VTADDTGARAASGVRSIERAFSCSSIWPTRAAGWPSPSAISISGPQGRLPLSVIDDVVPIMRRTAGGLAHTLSM
jgi:hypothetical protein